MTETASAGLVDFVRGGSAAGDELDDSFLGIAGEPVLAGVGRFSGRQASHRLLFASRKLKWSISVTPGVTATATRCCSASKASSRESAARVVSAHPVHGPRRLALPQPKGRLVIDAKLSR